MIDCGDRRYDFSFKLIWTQMLIKLSGTVNMEIKPQLDGTDEFDDDEDDSC